MRSSSQSPLARAPRLPRAWRHRPLRRAAPAPPRATRRPLDSSAAPSDICIPSSCAPLPALPASLALLGQLCQPIRAQYSADLLHLVRLGLAVRERLQVDDLTPPRFPHPVLAPPAPLTEAHPP